MKKITKTLSVFMAFSMLFCLSGCGNRKSEEEYKAAMSEHMKNRHNVSINSYKSFNIKTNGSASASIDVSVAYLDNFVITVDKNCNVISCPWCD